MTKVVTRFAPSPTGLLHGGNYRTALFSYLFARKNKGTFFLRIEDTDRARYDKKYEDNIIESLAWMGLSYDAMYRQSERVGRHQEILQKLIDGGHAYISREEKEGVTKDLVRFKNPGGVVSFTDLIRGEIKIDVTDLGDFVIAKNISEPLFHIAVVVDDIDMGVTHIVRGEDHISNTPRHLLLYRAIGAAEPTYAHLPLVLSPDRTKLSKRKGALPVTEYRDRGYLPEAVVNFLALIGWNPGTEQELFTLEQLVELFDLSQVNKGGAIFNEEKLQWFNREYLKKKPELVGAEIARVVGIAADSTMINKLLPIVIDRISTLRDIEVQYQTGDLKIFFETPTVDPSMLSWKGAQTKEEIKKHLEAIFDLLRQADDMTTPEKAKEIVWGYAEANGRGNVLWPLRVSLSGKEKSPDPFILISILGKDQSLKRIESALKNI